MTIKDPKEYTDDEFGALTQAEQAEAWAIRGKALRNRLSTIDRLEADAEYWANSIRAEIKAADQRRDECLRAALAK